MRVIHFGPVRQANRNKRVQSHRASWLAFLAVLATALLGCILPQVASADSELSPGLGTTTELGASVEPEEISSTPSTTKPYFACPHGLCDAINEPPPIKTVTGYALPDGKQLTGGGVNGGYTAEELESAYDIPKTGGKEPEQQTVAVVDAYGDSTAESDLAEYRKEYKLGECKKENSKKEVTNCFRKVNQKGEEANYPANDEGWGIETSLDLDMVSAACPECHILLVEATNEEFSNLGASVNKAVELGATEVSNSYGAPEDYEPWCGTTGCDQYDSDYDHPEYENSKHEKYPVVIMASTGDYGYDNHLFGAGVSLPSFPATSPYVVAVGGTEINIVKNARSTEKVWPRGGSGCSTFESTKTTGQKETEEKEGRKGCTGDRTDSDVAADASCETPVSFYSTPGFGGWNYECGTSASSPFVAGVEAHASKTTRALGANAFYKKPSMLFHVSEGSNGECGAESESKWYLCHATKEGYNGPTGMGTPDGVFTSTAAPTVTTGAATSVTETGATLNGTVNPNGSETKYYFEYGTTESYGSKTTEASAGSGESGVEENKVVTSLTPGKTYDFRITATNSESTIHGTNQEFTPGAPINTAAPVVSSTAPDQNVAETTTTGSWLYSPTSYTYQWERCNVGGGECTNISGATSSTYTPIEADVGHALVAKVTAINSYGSTNAMSAATSKVKEAGEIVEYTLPKESYPTGITEGPDGNLWYTDLWTSKIGKITTSGTITEYALPTGSDPEDITEGPDGNLWYTNEYTDKIGKITTSGAITEYSLPSYSFPYSITEGPDGNLWYTDLWTSKIGKITTSGTITEYSLPSESNAPEGITKGPDGNLWYADGSDEEGRIGEITTSGTITEYFPRAGDTAITQGPDGNLWFTMAGYEGTSRVGKITTSGVVTEYALPQYSYPKDITEGPNGDLWCTNNREQGDITYGQIDQITTSGAITEYELPTGSNPDDITEGPDGNLWYTNEDRSKIGKIVP